MDLDVSLTKHMPVVELLPELVRRAKRLVNCDRASLFLLTEDRTELTTILAKNSAPISVPADGTSIAGEAVTRGNVINLARADTHPSFNKEVDRRTGYKTRSMLVMPIRSSRALSSTIVGVVQCINKLGKVDLSANAADSEEALMKIMPTFSADDETALGELCRQIAPAVENVSLTKHTHAAAPGLTGDWIANVALMSKAPTEEIVRAARRSSSEATQILARITYWSSQPCLGPPPVQNSAAAEGVDACTCTCHVSCANCSQAMLTKTRDMVNADRASLFLVDRKRKELWSKIADNTPEIRVKLGAGIVGAVATMGKTLNVPDAYRDPRFNKKIDMATGYRTRQILCLPIKNQRSQVIGVVQCINKKRGGQVFTRDDEERLSELARRSESLRLRVLP